MGIEIEKFFRGNAKNSIYTATSIFGLVILISILFVIIPLLGEIKKNSNDIVVRKASLILLESQASEIGKFKNNYELYKPNFNKIDQLYVDPKNPVDFFKFLEAEASYYKIKSIVSLSANLTGKNIQFINFKISTQGNFVDILAFLEKIETGPYLIKAGNLIIKKMPQADISKKSNLEIVAADFSMEAYIKQ